MLPKKILVSKMRWFWTVFLLLSPLAYLLGARLITEYDPNALSNVRVDRQRAIAIATDFAASKGVNVSGWNSLCHFKINNELYFYYRLKSGAVIAEVDRTRAIAPAVFVGVLFRSKTRKEDFEVEMTTDDRIIGFDYRLDQSAEENDPGEPEARKIASEALQQRLAAAQLSVPIELQQVNSDDDNQNPPQRGPGRPRILPPPKDVRQYTWRWPMTKPGELKIESLLTVRAGKLSRDTIKAEVDAAFVKQRLNPHEWLRIASSILYSLVMGIFIIYGIYRFIQRARQKEVSYRRLLSLVLLIGAVITSFQALTDTILYTQAKTTMNPIWVDWFILSSIVVMNLLIGLFMGLAYASGEGDIREAYPGKLTSLDALLTGKFFSRNVARSMVWGCAIGGWVMMSMLLPQILWRNVPGTGEPPNQFVSDSLLGHAPWLSSFMAWPQDVVLVTVVGLLVPLPFVLRRKRLGRAKMPLLFIFAWIACASPYLVFRPWEAALLAGLLRAGLFLLAFFKFDLLTAVIALAYPAFLSFALLPAVQPNPTLSRSGIFSLAMAVIILAIEMIFAFKGRLYRDDEVRPLYAGMLTERISMQAEVTAAREAQQRLMPAELPKSEHFSIAACCSPAFEVGGDFYDVFKLEDGKVGVLIAEGGGRGLGSALSIAYAKGFLMPKILKSEQTQSEQDDSPTEIIRGLQDRLASLLEEDSGLGLAYAVFDASDGQLRYARTGQHPVIMLKQSKETSGFHLPEEREIRFSTTRQSGPASSQTPVPITIVEGTATLNAGDSVVLFTDGLAKDWQRNKTTPETEFAKTIKSADGKSADSLQEALAFNIRDCAKQARKQGLEDDLTAVIVRFEKKQIDIDEDQENLSAPKGEMA